jgi:hypothetical protein
MQLLILASIGLLFFGALATWLIAHFLPDEIMRNGTHHGRYAYLGEDEVKEIRSPTRRIGGVRYKGRSKSLSGLGPVLSGGRFDVKRLAAVTASKG